MLLMGLICELTLLGKGLPELHMEVLHTTHMLDLPIGIQIGVHGQVVAQRILPGREVLLQFRAETSWQVGRSYGQSRR